MTQHEALDILKTGASVFLTGEPGAGKTHTVSAYVAYLRERKIEPAITASTGIAATHIGGMTIHSWSGIGIKETLTRYDLDRLAANEYLYRRVSKARVLIIDEISMLRADTLSMVDAVCREIRRDSQPFGGLQVVLVGDFFQLPPIQKSAAPERQASLGQEEKPVFAYESPAWQRLRPVVCYLSEQHRQDDEDFLALLSAIRRGAVEEMHYEYLKARHIAGAAFPEQATKLFSHNADVDRINDQELVKIAGDSREFLMDSTGPEALVAALKKGCLSPERLSLKAGAVVMCTKNNPKEHYVNGSLGTVTGFGEFSGNPLVRMRSGKTVEMASADWMVEEGGKVRAKITQLPLRLAWAMTVHKSQGMSMDAAVMDLSAVFEYGQGYVALSRVRRLSGLYLLGMNARALEVHPRILEDDALFRAASEEARKTFGALPKAELGTMHKNFVLASDGTWKEPRGEGQEAGGESPAGRLEKIREKHENAYRKWTAEEEQKVAEDFKGGATIKELAARSGRQTGGIRARLIKLGLIEEK